MNSLEDRAWFDDGNCEAEIRLSNGEVVSWKPKPGITLNTRTLNMLPYVQLKSLIESIGDTQHIHYANVAGLEKEPIGGQDESALQR